MCLKILAEWQTERTWADCSFILSWVFLNVKEEDGITATENKPNELKPNFTMPSEGKWYGIISL